MVAFLISFPIAAFYIFAALPAVDGFPMLVAVLAPLFLLLGALQGNPPTYPVALALLLGISGALSLQAVFVSDFQIFANNYLGIFTGIGAALVATRLFRSVGADWSARRLIRISWRDLAVNASARPVDCIDRGAWTSSMLDRLGMLIPRLALAERRDEILTSADLLGDLRTGLTVADIQRARTVVGPVAERSLGRVMGHVAGYFRKRGIGRALPVPAILLAEIDEAIGDVAGDRPSPERQVCLWSLTGLRRNLFPQAGPYIPVTLSEAAQ
jgi:uncharacterized membrane protein YccC